MIKKKGSRRSAEIKEKGSGRSDETASYFEARKLGDITKLHLEGRCVHRPTALGGAICKLHRPNFFFLQMTLN